MSEVKNWLLSLGIPGIERLTEEFESRGFSTRKSLQYLQDGDLDYIFSSPKRLLLAEKRALTHELQKIKSWESQDGHLRPRQLNFCQNSQQAWSVESPACTTTREIDSPLDRRKQELVENVSFLEAQISSAEEHLAKLKGENDLLQTVTRGRICSHCHQSGHNKNSCRGVVCDSHLKCKLKDKHPDLGKSISETQKTLTVLRKNKETAKQTLEQFMMQLQRSRGSFFAVMRPRLKRLNPVKYLNRQELDRDLLYLQKALENKIPPETEDWRLPYLVNNCKSELNPMHKSGSETVTSVNNYGDNSNVSVCARYHPYNPYRC